MISDSRKMFLVGSRLLPDYPGIQCQIYHLSDNVCVILVSLNYLLSKLGEIIYGKTSVTPVENSTRSLIICYISFRTINFACFQSYMLATDTSRPTLNAISNE
jgi:hypothetical protein